MARNSYRDLLVWQRAMDLVVSVYRATRVLPDEERYGLQSQARRAAVSVPSNVAEGQGRFHVKEFLQSLGVARSSLQELQTQIEVMNRLDYLDRREATVLAAAGEEVARLLGGLIQALRKRSSGVATGNSKLPTRNSYDRMARRAASP
jgi:four helix bundle protein